MGRLGRMANVDVKTIRHIYQHPTQSITLSVLDRIAEVLDVDASTLIESVRPPKNTHANEPDD